MGSPQARGTLFLRGPEVLGLYRKFCIFIGKIINNCPHWNARGAGNLSGGQFLFPRRLRIDDPLPDPTHDLDQHVIPVSHELRLFRPGREGRFRVVPDTKSGTVS